MLLSHSIHSVQIRKRKRGGTAFYVPLGLDGQMFVNNMHCARLQQPRIGFVVERETMGRRSAGCSCSLGMNGLDAVSLHCDFRPYLAEVALLHGCKVDCVTRRLVLHRFQQRHLVKRPGRLVIATWCRVANLS